MAQHSAASCRPCESGPRGDRGHVDLRERFRFGGGGRRGIAVAHYSCAVCARIWERRALGRGHLWLPVAYRSPVRAVPMLAAA